MIRIAWAVAALISSTAVHAREPAGLHAALDELTRQGKFSGAVVVRDAEGVRFARGYGFADPFSSRRFTPETPVDSASLAKPVTATAVLILARDGRIDLDAPVRRYLPEFPHADVTVRHLLVHSAGLPLDESPQGLAGKDNAALLGEIASQRLQPLFAPGTAFNYCNLCYSALAMLIERVTGQHFLAFVREQAQLPNKVILRPRYLADWSDRAIGYRRNASGGIERFDSWEGELLYGPANFSISASQLADWGAQWWKPPLASIRAAATAPAVIAGKASGLTLGNWYCARGRRRCHYLGHHEGFHHMLYWDGDRRLSVAMVSNNALAPSLQQRLQRALVDFAQGSRDAARTELRKNLADTPVEPGGYLLPGGERLLVEEAQGRLVNVIRGGISYPAYPIGSGIRYVPGLDVYIAGAAGHRMHWLSLYEDLLAAPA